jgi:hypothetical protein
MYGQHQPSRIDVINAHRDRSVGLPVPERIGQQLGQDLANTVRTEDAIDATTASNAYGL